MLQSRFTRGPTRFVRDERGSTAIEYALIASVISIAIVGSASSIGNTLIDNFYNKIIGGMDQAGMSDGNEEVQ